MAVSPPGGRAHFPAPPPSPIGTGRRSCVTNDDVLTEFLEHSLRVPDLVLPDRIFPRQISLQSPPTIDLRSLMEPPGRDEALSRIFESFAGIGCFQLTNHGISPDWIRSASDAAAGIFKVSSEKKALASRSPENPYGFDEIHGEDDDGELGEEFVWSRNESLKADMEGIWPLGYSHFRCNRNLVLPKKNKKKKNKI